MSNQPLNRRWTYNDQSSELVLSRDRRLNHTRHAGAEDRSSIARGLSSMGSMALLRASVTRILVVLVLSRSGPRLLGERGPPCLEFDWGCLGPEGIQPWQGEGTVFLRPSFQEPIPVLYCRAPRASSLRGASCEPITDSASVPGSSRDKES